jgi:hypothetical protein
LKAIYRLEDLSLIPGLLEYIEGRGAAGEFRNDQISRAVASIFDGIQVDKSLLYRTAKKAQERVFGKSPSDVLVPSLLAM